MINTILRGFGYAVGTILGLVFMALLISAMAIIWVFGGRIKITNGNTVGVYRWFTLVDVYKKGTKE